MAERLEIPLRQIAAAAIVVLLIVTAAPGQSSSTAQPNPLLGLMESELRLSLDKLISPDGTKPYFLQYWVTQEDEVRIAGTLGSITQNRVTQTRILDVDVRCGDYALDSTRQIRGGGAGGGDYGGWGGTSLPLNDDPLATRHAIWLATDARFKSAVKRLLQVQANLKVKVEEDDPSADFSHEPPSVHIGPWLNPPDDRDQLAARVKRLAQRFRSEPLIYSSSVTLTGDVTNRLAVNSEGSRLQFG